jgi:hypothetical protein
MSNTTVELFIETKQRTQKDWLQAIAWKDESMLRSSISDKDVKMLHANILPPCSKGGYELIRTRTGGAEG